MNETDLVDLLERAVEHVHPGPPPISSIVEARRRRRRTTAVAAALIVLIIGGATYVWSIQGQAGVESHAAAGNPSGDRTRPIVIDGTWNVLKVWGPDTSGAQVVYSGSDPESFTVTLAFARGEITGDTLCKATQTHTGGSGGPYEPLRPGHYAQSRPDGSDLRLSRVTLPTNSLCKQRSPDFLPFDPRLLDAVRHVTRVGDRLYLQSASWAIIAELTPEQTPTQ